MKALLAAVKEIGTQLLTELEDIRIVLAEIRNLLKEGKR